MIVENSVRNIGAFHCRCGCRLLTDDNIEYYCAACGFRIMHAELKRLEDGEQEKADARAFM